MSCLIAWPLASCLPACLVVCMSLCLSSLFWRSLSLSLYLCLFGLLSVCSFGLSVSLSVWSSICLSLYLSLCPYVASSVCLFVFTYALTEKNKMISIYDDGILQYHKFNSATFKLKTFTNTAKIIIIASKISYQILVYTADLFLHVKWSFLFELNQ